MDGIIERARHVSPLRWIVKRAKHASPLREIGAEGRAAWAVARKNLRVMARYKLNTISLVLISLYQLLIPSMLMSAAFLVGGRAVGFARSAGTTDVAGFLFLGAAASTLIFGAFWNIGWQFRLEMEQGTLEPLWLTPVRRHTMVIGFALGDLVLSAFTSVLLLLIGGLFFGAHYLLSIASALPALGLAAVALLGIGYLVASMVLLIKEANFLVDAGAYLFSMASGISFPLSVLPGALAAVPFFLPTTYAIDILRQQALHTRPLLPLGVEYVLLAVITVALVPLGMWVFSRTERRLRRLGTLGTY
jgi:ABC-2 type transport system permease protein